MLVIVVSVSLMVELPMAIFAAIVVFNFSFGLGLEQYAIYPNIEIFINFSIILSYPFNFFLYCFMSKQFRDQVNLVLGLKKSAP